MWFKHALKAQKLQKQHALKAQKLQKQHALKGQKLLAQGIALGMMAISRRPVRAKALLMVWYFKAFALTGRQVCVRNYPGRCPGLGASALSGRVGKTRRVGKTCESSERVYFTLV